jgi:hypothetical protein
VTPRQCSWNCSRRERVQAKVQRLKNWTHSAKGAHPYGKACRSRGFKVAAPPLDTLRQAGNISRGQQNTRKILKRKKRTFSLPLRNSLNCFRINVMVGVLALKNERFIMFCAFTAHQTPTRMLSKLTSYTPKDFWKMNICYYGCWYFSVIFFPVAKYRQWTFVL